ncbi:PAS domain-containing protein [Pontibacter sp. Tf4]|uniref:PAS domain-containing protein n=1 Tax=Pontibacter sp. Tf4 TaxID=2761620 RepID=UPI001625E0BA|nr:PAS domain-containing protein [Pontibacter sp. Tf4]MBB6610568.1 PAS domain-containing protein [Pontibacter sp. Tf4]
MLRENCASNPIKSSPATSFFARVFEAQTSLSLLLAPDLEVIGVTDSLLQETYTRRENVVGKNVFVAFPENPAAPEASPIKNLKKAFDIVFETGKPHKLPQQRYDIPDPELPGSFLERYWSTHTVPILDEQGVMISILHETTNITAEVKAKHQLNESIEREQKAIAVAEQQRLRLKRLFDHAPAALAIVEGPDLVYKEINETYQQLFPGRQLLGLPMFEALPELSTRPSGEALRNVYKTGESYKGKEFLLPFARYAGASEEDIYWNFINQALYDTEGNVNGILLFALDVTDFILARQNVEEKSSALRKLNLELEERVNIRSRELQQAKAEADKHSRRMYDLFMQAPAAICILNGPDMVYELVNPVYEQLFTDRKLLGKPILEALPEIKEHRVYETFKRVYETGETHKEAELLIPFKRAEDGEMEDRYFRFIQQARYNEQEQVDGIIVFALEVTEQVNARKAVELSEAQLRLVTDSLPVLIGYLDKEEKYRFTNKAYESWFPFKAESLLGRKVRDVIGEDAYQNVKVFIEQALAGVAVSFEARMPYRDNFVKYIQTNYVPDVQDGEVQGFYTLVTDVTEQVLAREALEQSELKAKSIAEMLAVANDDLKLANETLGIYNSELEKRVEERTSALKNTNTLLQKQIKENIKAEESLFKSHAQLQALTKHLQQLREEERKFLARELHDELGQAFTALKIDVALSLKKLDTGTIEHSHLHQELSSMLRTINRSITSVREIVKSLRPSVLDNFGLLSEVESQAQDLKKRIGATVEVITELEYLELTQEVSIEVFRIIQEIMTNIARHAEASHVYIKIAEKQNAFHFTITDNGKGMLLNGQPEVSTFGLIGMQERADRIGAKLSISSKIRRGTTIELEVPCKL